MFFAADSSISAAWASVWSWVLANSNNSPVIIIVLLTVGVVLPVMYLAITTTVRAFRQNGDINGNNSALPVAVGYRGGVVNPLHGSPPPAIPAIAVRSHQLEMMEEGLPMPPPPSVLQMTCPNVQPAPCPDELRMLRAIKNMYIMLAQTLTGTAASLSSVERMNAACSLVARTVATLGSWRAPAAVVSLLQPAKDVTDLFSRRMKKGGSGGMSKGRQIHYVALLNKRARTMEEVIEQALWARTMPTVPANLRDATTIIALADKLAGAGRNSNSSRRASGTVNAAVPSGVRYIPYRGPPLAVACRACHVEGGGGAFQQ